MADNDDKDSLAAEGVDRHDILRLALRPQVAEGVEQRDRLRDLFRPQVAEGVEYEHPDFIAADKKLVEELQKTSFGSPAWREVSHALASYGLPVMQYWLASEGIFVLCQRRRFGLQRPAREHWARADLEGLANEVVAHGLKRFKRALQDGAWDPGGGATLRTFFMGACVLEFPNLYRKFWLRTDSKSSKLEKPESDIVAGSSSPDPGEVVAMRIEIQEALRNIPDDATRTAVILHWEGYSYREIGEFLDLSHRAVEGLLRRQRERWQNRPTPRTGGRK